MVIKTIFELESISDQLALLNSLTSHIDLEVLEAKDANEDFRRLLIKINNNAKNLKDKYDKIMTILNN